MKKFNLTCYVTGIYNTSIMVPDDLDREGALQYAIDHFDEVPRGKVYDFLNGSDDIDDENCGFDEDE